MSGMETILHRLDAAQATNAFFNRWMGAKKIDQGTPCKRINDEEMCRCRIGIHGKPLRGIVQLLQGSRQARR